MQMRTTRAALVCGVVLMAMTGLGCGSGASGGARPSVDQLPEGLTVFASGDTAVSGAFKEGGTAIYFETRRGAPTLAGFKELMPDIGDYEMDARFLDAKGNTLMVQRGGDEFVDPSWAQDLAAQNALKTGIRLDVGALALAQKMATSVHQQLPSAAPHLTALSGLAGAATVRAQVLTPQPNLAGDVQTQGTSWCNWDYATMTRRRELGACAAGGGLLVGSSLIAVSVTDGALEMLPPHRKSSRHARPKRRRRKSL
jgi:hypothetical protein